MAGYHNKTGCNSLDYLDIAGFHNKAGCNYLDMAGCSKAAGSAPAFLHAVQASRIAGSAAGFASGIAGSAAGFASGFAAISTAAG